MNQSTELTMEQEFSLNRFTSQVQNITREQAQELLIEQQRIMMIRDTLFKQLLRTEWNLDPTASSS
jgi:hypothetical protein